MGASIKDTAATVRARKAKNAGIPLSAGMILVTLGVVYGDIGTSPMYTLKSIVSNNGGISTVSESLIIGALSLVIWTMTLVTTVKYVVIAMKADNHHEGGIFALYSLVKRCAKWLIIPAMVGGAALLADGILTPAVTVTTAIEGLRTIPLGHEILGDGQGLVMGITIVIVCGLFAVQRAGTSSIGKFFGPVMTLWFLFLGGAGLLNMFSNPVVLKALNPIYGIRFLASPVNRSGLRVMGYVFLATTGAEALYSDMGHVGKSNIYASWPAVKACLILNYLGQGAWLLGCDPTDPSLTGVVNPFYQMLPEMIRPFAIVLSAVAAIIASQALITGSYTLVSEAVRLDLMPHMRINYPSETKGQIYIPLVNSIMWIGTIFVVLLFQTSERMEAAYGLAITITMLMTTTLLTSYIAGVRKKPAGAVVFAIVFGAIEVMFFASCLTMFLDGGYVMVILAAILFVVMYTWRRGTAIERTQTVFLPVDKYLDQLFELCHDDEVPYLADNLVFLTNDSSIDKLDRDILYSILDKQPKRAKAYYFLNVQVTDEPFTHEYIVNDFDTDFLFKVQLRLGFKVNQRVNTYLYQIVAELVENHQIAPQNHKYSIYRTHSAVGDFRFCLIRKVISPETDLSGLDYRVMELKYLIRRMCGSPAKWYGLENSSLLFEYVPLFSKKKTQHKLTRIQLLDAEPSSPKKLEKSASTEPESNDDDDIFTMTMRDELQSNIVNTFKDLVGGDTASFKPLVIDNEDDEDDDDLYGSEDEVTDGGE